MKQCNAAYSLEKGFRTKSGPHFAKYTIHFFFSINPFNMFDLTTFSNRPFSIRNHHFWRFYSISHSVPIHASPPSPSTHPNLFTFHPSLEVCKRRYLDIFFCSPQYILFQRNSSPFLRIKHSVFNCVHASSRHPN